MLRFSVIVLVHITLFALGVMSVLVELGYLIVESVQQQSKITIWK